METQPTPDETPDEITDVEVVEASVEPDGLGEIEVDITEDLTDDQIRDLFAAFNDEDWDEVDRLIDGFDANGVYTDSKAGGADRNRGSAEQLRKYWTVGVGGQKIRWGSPGDWTRCVALVGKHLGPRAKGYCALRHKEMNGYYPGDKKNKSDAARNEFATTNKPSASVVLGSGDGFEMVGADASTDGAEMVNVKASGNVPVSDDESNPVRSDDLSVRSKNLTIPSASTSGEQPAAVRSESKVAQSVSGSARHVADRLGTDSSGSAKASVMSTTQSLDGVLGDKPVASRSAADHHKTVAHPEIEFKVVSLKGMNVVDAEKGIVETIISVTGIVDNVKDRILPGAYSKTLAKRKPKGVWSHDWDTPVSKTLDVKELMPGDPELPQTMPDGDPWPAQAGALKVKTQFNLDTQRGREAYSDVVFFADEQEWSIGYNVPVGGAKVDTKSGVREIETLELYEYSPVLFGAMPLARTTSVKEAQLAMKALKGGAASWLSEVPAEEVAPAGPDAEEKDAAEELGDYELPADQMVLVKRAIATLTDLLSVVQGAEFKAEPMDEEEEATEPEDSPEEEAAEEPAEDEVTEYDSLSSAVDDMITDADLKSAMLEAAGPVDDAIASDDADAMDSSTSAFLDVVEKALKDGKEEGTLKEVAAMMADLIQSVVGEAPSEETQEEKAEPAEGNVILNTEEITSLLDSLK